MYGKEYVVFYINLCYYCMHMLYIKNIISILNLSFCNLKDATNFSVFSPFSTLEWVENAVLTFFITQKRKLKTIFLNC